MNFASNFSSLAAHVRPRIVEKTALTSGDWTVVDKEIWVDESRGLIYFHGLKESPLERHLYVVSMDEPGNVRRLTSHGCSHNAQLNEDCTMFVTSYSSIQSAPASRVFRIGHRDSTVDGVILTHAGCLVEPKGRKWLDRDHVYIHCMMYVLFFAVLDDYQGPELFSHDISSGDKLYGMIFKPRDMQPNERYPVVLQIYGGPEVQLVSNTFKVGFLCRILLEQVLIGESIGFQGLRQMRNHLLAAQGYCVVCIDSRGSQNRGTAFEAHIRLRMGQVELSDQIEVLQYLANVTGYMDMDRVGIMGWSYGGYLALMGLAKYPHVFKVSIAGAPVSSWLAYDTGYTERYMDLPSLNADGYRMGSILSYANEFPDE